MANLTAREFLFVQAATTGLSAEQACIEAGYSAAYARKNAHKLMKRPKVAAAIEEAREQIKVKAQWTAERLLEKFEHAYARADASNQTMSMVRAAEAIGKLTGLLQDRLKLEVEARPSLIGAIEAGRERAGRVGAAPPQMIDVTPREDAPEGAALKSDATNTEDARPCKAAIIDG